MNDTTLRALGDEEFKKLLTDALRLYREGDLLTLSASPLAQTALLERWYVGNAPSTSDARGRAMQAMLRWLVARLRPSGPQQWTAQQWRSYNVLTAFYLEGCRVAELAERLAVAEQTVYPARAQAVATLSKLLREELAVAPDAQPNYAIIEVYGGLPAAQQTLLRLASVFRQALPAAVVYDLARVAAVEAIEHHLLALTDSTMLLVDDQRRAFLLQPKLRPYLRTLLTPEENRQWQHAAHAWAAQQGDYLLAATHLRRSGDAAAAAHLLLQHHQAIIDDLHLPELRRMLGEFHAGEVGNLNLWARLKLLMGDVAMQLEDVDTALREYQQALRAPDLVIKAEAYGKRGRAFRATNTDEAMAHVAYAVELLEATAAQHPLLFQLRIEQAWMLFQDRAHLDRAAQALQHAETLVERTDRAQVSDLRNAWGTFYAHRNDHQRAMEEHRQAWLAANEIADTTRMTHTAHNLGNDYCALAQYPQALDYLQQSAALAAQTGNRRMQGLCSKNIGACFFWMGRYEDAIQAYQQAHAIFVEMQNRNWQATVCYDLAEAYAEQGDAANMRLFFDEAVALARSSGLDRLLNDLDELAARYVGLYPPAHTLNERQHHALDWLKAHASITNLEYRTLTNVSPKQAARDLQELAEHQLVIRVGEGRATRYRMPDDHVREKSS